MKKFTKEEALYILKNQSTMTLGELATLFDCTWKDIYECYSLIIRTRYYKRYVDEERLKRYRMFHKEARNDS